MRFDVTGIRNNMKKTLLIGVFFVWVIAGAFAQDSKNVRLAIVFIGNSITQGKGGPAGLPPPLHAVEYLRAQKGVEQVSFANIGKSGSTTVDWLPGSGKYAQLVKQKADSLFAEKDCYPVFSLKLGTNDSAMEGPNGAPVSREAYRQNMQMIINDLLDRYPGCKVVVNFPIWYSENTYNRSKYLAEGLGRLESYFPELESMIKDYASRRPGLVFKGDTRAFKHFKKNYLKLLKPENGQQGTFYLHPNEEGVGILGRYWGKAIARAVL
jgi:hypothetical protein